jgi:hypothetical protein
MIHIDKATYYESRTTRIKVNGDDVTSICFAASDEEGWADIFVWNKEGLFYIDPITQELATKRLFGNVEIFLDQPLKIICKNCEHFNWKFSGLRNWGECLNPNVQDALGLSLKLESISKCCVLFEAEQLDKSKEE